MSTTLADEIQIHSRNMFSQHNELDRPSVSGDEDRDNFRVIFADTPGITNRADTDTEVFDEVTKGNTTYQGFIFVIKAENVEIRKEGLQTLMEDIESSIIQRSGEMSPESALFIVNKFDLVPDEEKRDFIDDVKDQLIRKWPRINERNIVFMSAKENRIYHGGTCQSFVGQMRRFVNEVIRLSLEEHCLWLLNLLEVICAIMKTGNNWISARHSTVQLRQHLYKLQSDASMLSEELTNKPDNILDEILKEINQDFVGHLDVKLNWEISEIDREIPRLDIDWKDITETVDVMICRKILKENEDQIEKLRLKYERKWREVYRSELEEIRRLEESLQGLKMNGESKTNITQGVATALAPVAFSGVIRLAPFTAPFLFLVFPVLPIPLVLKMLYDEYRDYKNDQDREKLKADKVTFVNNRTSQIIQKIHKSLSKDKVEELRDSPLFCHLFGQFPRTLISHKVEEIINTINMLQTLDLSNKNGDYNLCNRILGRVMDIYTNGILEHDVQPEKIVFEKNKQNNRVPLGHNRSVVYKAKIDHAGEVAVKELLYDSDLSSDREESIHSDLDVYRECFMLRQLSKTPCENIVKFLGSSFMSEIIEDRTVFTLWLVFERCDGTLKDVIQTIPKIKRERYDAFKWYTAQLLRGLKFLHDRNIVHRDMKPSNCLLRKTGGSRPIVKIADIGAAKQKDLICTTARNRGTLAYWAPEIVRSSTIRFHSKASDIYSLGLILWELWFRDFAYNCFNIINGEVPSKFPDVTEVKDILKICLDPNMFARASVNVLMQLPLLQDECFQHSNIRNSSS